MANEMAKIEKWPVCMFFSQSEENNMANEKKRHF